MMSLLLACGGTSGALAVENSGALRTNSQIKVLDWGGVAVAQMTVDGRFDVICKDKTRETVSQIDFRLGNVCPTDPNLIITGVLSVQQRSDGQFDVVCTDFTKIVATSEQILHGQVCASASTTEPPPPPKS
ncbi:MAG: hypothetical protein C5B49_07795 [Bdellovibrio sp.]|nr:MAG: hypothetical protein C5B49_07795 [Bdellovibrio sp.]